LQGRKKNLLMSSNLIKIQNNSGRAVGGLWVRLGKIKCAAKALALVSACSSFNFAKRWHFGVHF
jgi:hypothetical protein